MKKILAIDDETAMLDLLKSVLEKKGYHVEACKDPLDAAQRLQECQFDLVLLDIQMPQRDGFAVYRGLAKPRVPVLFVTGHPEAFMSNSEEFTRMWQRELGIGTTDILYKPFEIDALYYKVESLIGEPGES